MKRLLAMSSMLLLALPALAQETPALRAVKALQSATRAGLSVREYRPRVVDAKVLVDRHLHDEAEDRRAAISRAMDFHIAAAAAWSESIGRYGVFLVAGHPVIQTCPRAAEFVEKSQQDLLNKKALMGRETLMRAVRVFWACATENVSEAEGHQPPTAPRDKT